MKGDPRFDTARRRPAWVLLSCVIVFVLYSLIPNVIPLLLLGVVATIVTVVTIDTCVCLSGLIVEVNRAASYLQIGAIIMVTVLLTISFRSRTPRTLTTRTPRTLTTRTPRTLHIKFWKTRGRRVENILYFLISNNAIPRLIWFMLILTSLVFGYIQVSIVETDLDWRNDIVEKFQKLREREITLGPLIPAIIPTIVITIFKKLLTWYDNCREELRYIKRKPARMLLDMYMAIPRTRATSSKLMSWWLASIVLSFKTGIFWFIVFVSALCISLSISVSPLASLLEPHGPHLHIPEPQKVSEPMIGLPVLFGTARVESPPDVIFSTESWGIRLEHDSETQLKEWLNLWAPPTADLEFLVVGYASHTPIIVEGHDRFELNVQVANLRAKTVWSFLNKQLRESGKEELARRMTQCIKWSDYRTLQGCRPYNKPVTALEDREYDIALLERMNQSVMVYVMNGKEWNSNCIGGEPSPTPVRCSDLPSRYP